jgi:hypothetical protein
MCFQSSAAHSQAGDRILCKRKAVCGDAALDGRFRLAIRARAGVMNLFSGLEDCEKLMKVLRGTGFRHG